MGSIHAGDNHKGSLDVWTVRSVRPIRARIDVTLAWYSSCLILLLKLSVAKNVWQHLWKFAFLGTFPSLQTPPHTHTQFFTWALSAVWTLLGSFYGGTFSYRRLYFKVDVHRVRHARLPSLPLCQICLWGRFPAHMIHHNISCNGMKLTKKGLNKSVWIATLHEGFSWKCAIEKVPIYNIHLQGLFRTPLGNFKQWIQFRSLPTLPN